MCRDLFLYYISTQGQQSTRNLIKVSLMGEVNPGQGSKTKSQAHKIQWFMDTDRFLPCIICQAVREGGYGLACGPLSAWNFGKVKTTTEH